jgi:hypothetical protein
VLFSQSTKKRAMRQTHRPLAQQKSALKVSYNYSQQRRLALCAEGIRETLENIFS